MAGTPTSPQNPPDEGVSNPSSSTMNTMRRTMTSPATLGLILRLVGFHMTSLPASLETSHILSTPFDGFRHLKEGTYYHSQSVKAYASPQFHHHPLYLSIFSTLLPINPSSGSYILTSSAFILADFASASALRRIWRARRREEKGRLDGGRRDREGGVVFNENTDGRPIESVYSKAEASEKVRNTDKADALRSGYRSQGRRWLRDGWDDAVMSLFLLNPYSILSCLARSTRTIDNALVLTSIGFACEDGSLPFSMFLLALATHTSIYPILLFPFLVLLNERFTSTYLRVPPNTMESTGGTSADVTRWDAARRQRLRARAFEAIAWFVASFLAVYAVCDFSMSGMRWEKSVWYDLLAVADLTPNVGLSWYLFTEMFDHFRPFFVGVFQLHLLTYVAPLCMRLCDQPLLATVIMTGIIATFKSYPTWGDAAVWIGLLACFPDLWATLRHPLLTVCVHLYTSILLPLLHHLWLVAGTGNANFFYAATLVYGLGCGMGVVDLLAAGIKDEIGKKAMAIGTWEDEEGSSPQEVLEARSLHVVQFGTLD